MGIAALIRLLLQTGFALLLAVLVAVAGYELLVAAASAPTPLAAKGPEPQPPAALEVDVAPPPPVREVDVAPASLTERPAWPRPLGHVTLQVRGEQGASVDGLGVGVVDGTSGAVLAWKPLSGTLPMAVELDSVPLGRHWAVLAKARAVARSGYLTRNALDVAVREGTVRGSASLDARRYDVEVRLQWPATVGDVPLLVPILRRTDDPDWVPVGPGAPIEAATFTLEGLGAGEYALEIDGIDLTPSPTFQVPDVTTLRIPCRLP